MAELTTSERLQPSLLDRLIDDEPKNRNESRDKRVLSMRQLREAVMRDLSWLMNSSAKPSGDEIWEYPLVARSVVNFGMLDLTGMTASIASEHKLERLLADAIHHFEPRIMGPTLQVRLIEGTEDEAENLVQFEISGDLCPLPMPEALFLKTELDLETGQCALKESSGGS